MTGPLNFFNYRLIFVDCEGANLEPWGDWPLREFGAVDYATRISFYGEDNSRQTFERFLAWLEEFDTERMVFISDNPAYDWPPIKWYFMKHDLENPFGHSARRIGDFYAGLTGDFFNASRWKRLRQTPHDHNPVNDALGNAEAFERMLRGERG